MPDYSRRQTRGGGGGVAERAKLLETFISIALMVLTLHICLTSIHVIHPFALSYVLSMYFSATMMVQLSRQTGSVVVTATSDRHISQYIKKENIIFKV